jgi:D,D-heptose 1,7-bisphosphate phosphatase
MQIVILAGGKGTRLLERTGELPKPMVEVGGKPLLEHHVLLGRRYGCTDFLFLTGFGAEHIRNYFGDGSRWSVRITHYVESEPLGTGGALLNAFERLEDRFLVLYGDTMLDVDLNRMMAAHSEDADATLFVHPNDHPQDSDLVEIDSNGRIVAFHPYPHPNGRHFGNLATAALYAITKNALAEWRLRHESCRMDCAKDLFPQMLARGRVLRSYRSREYIRDAGTPARLDRVRSDYAAGRPQSRAWRNPVPAVFLDRDGTLNVDRHWINSPEQLQLVPGAADAVRAINEAGYLAVVITNQPVIARGECTEAQLIQIHNRLEWLLGESHAFVDAIYYCPHHPEKGFPGERTDLKFACSCRKPAAGLLELAAKDLNIDRAGSWMVGDSLADVEAARAFGISSVLLTPDRSSTSQGASKADAEAPTLTKRAQRAPTALYASSLLDATHFILNSHSTQR